MATAAPADSTRNEPRPSRQPQLAAYAAALAFEESLSYGQDGGTLPENIERMRAEAHRHPPGLLKALLLRQAGLRQAFLAAMSHDYVEPNDS